MEKNASDQTDEASIKPVSSLRSQFESLHSSRSSTPATSNAPALEKKHTLRSQNVPSLQHPTPVKPIASLPRANSSSQSPKVSDNGSTSTHLDVDASYRQRPVSMLSPSNRSSPSRPISSLAASPSKSIDIPGLAQAHQSLQRELSSPVGSKPKDFNILDKEQPRITGNGAQSHQASPILDALDIPQKPMVGRRSFESPIPSPTQAPSVNRAGKPRIPAKDISLQVPRNRDVPAKPTKPRASPFNTPPDSNENSPVKEAPPQIPLLSKPNRSSSGASANDSNHSNLSRPAIPNRGNDTNAFLSASKHNDERFTRPVSRGREEEKAPTLPPRRSTSGPKISAQPKATLEASSRPSALTQGFSKGGPGRDHAQHHSQHVEREKDQSRARPAPLPARPTATNTARVDSTPRAELVKSSSLPVSSHRSTPSDDRRLQAANSTSTPASVPNDSPITSRSNRRPPTYKDGPKMISTGYDARLMDVCGEYVCTTGILTRVWSVLTGKLLLSLAPAENIKITALAFKPARGIDEEGTKLWLGTNWGEIQEVDIPSKSIVATNMSAHGRREITRIHRHAAELWTIDDEGKLFVWPPDTAGSPNLEVGVINPKLPRGRTSSVVVGARLWYACGKDIRVFAPSAQPNSTSFQLSDGPLPHSGIGEITSSAILSTQPDYVYFGHSDGRISVYSRKEMKLRRTVHVSNYKVSCLIGAGSYLWTGLNNGKLCVYDTTSKPWTLKKAWHPHNHPVTSLVIDRSSIWKLDRLQVLSLGIDNTIGVWDGMLQDDWLEDDMQSHNADYCKFDDATALIMTWNVGASTPTALRYEEQDRNFFQDFVKGKGFPDILVFGFQELVDLEDKKLTAKSFFKSKAKDPYGQEQLSSVYRAWRDYLTLCLDECLGSKESYALLHTASLVGLFTCIFVKSSLRPRISDLEASDVKTGMGGLHGNKGALIVRFLLDDSSICFVNCHLAAGQTNTASRNQDAAAILENPHLSRLTSSESELFICGGDGSMVLDHELCVLNGDLNYRIDTMTRDTIVSTLKTNNLTKLLDRDQLLLSRKKNPSLVLRDFDEGEISFAPTYKYDVGTDIYDTGDKRRSPAWCDRILFRGGDRIKQVNYRRHEVHVSDHRAVSSFFKMRVKTIDARKREECRQKSLQRFDKFKAHVSDQAKLDYLMNVFGLSPAEAKRRLEA